MPFAINAYTGNWVQTETICLFDTREDAQAHLDRYPWIISNRPGITVVIEELPALEQTPFRPTPNARFWQWVNDGWVKITLRPGESLHYWKSAPTDEGYFSYSEEWTHNGDVVSVETASYSRDCDGPLERFSSHECPLSDLAGWESYPNDFDFVGPNMLAPNWREVGSCQRDHYAESMNY